MEQYNGFYDAQNDTQYGKEPFRLSEIRTAPFYACKLSGMALATLDGIKINTKFQALDENNAPSRASTSSATTRATTTTAPTRTWPPA